MLNWFSFVVLHAMAKSGYQQNDWGSNTGGWQKRHKSGELNIYGGLYVSRNPKLKVKVVDGSSLVVAVVLNSIPKGTTQVLLRGKLNKVAYAIAFKLCQQGVKVSFFNLRRFLTRYPWRKIYFKLHFYLNFDHMRITIYIRLPQCTRLIIWISKGRSITPKVIWSLPKVTLRR